MVEQRLWDQLSAAGLDVVPVFHDTGRHSIPAGAVIMTDASIEKARLRVVPDWGWRCGDYALYTLRLLKPDYEYYWLIEPDVFIKGDAAEFFGRFDEATEDLLGLDPTAFKSSGHKFVQRLVGMSHWRAIFALTRASANLLDRLYELRVKDSVGEANPKHQANDEMFVYSHAKSISGVGIGNLRDYAPDWFHENLFETNPDFLRDWLEEDETMPFGVFHPVREKDEFLQAFPERVLINRHVLGKLYESLAYLNDEDIALAAKIAAKHFQKSISDASRKGRRRLKQSRQNK